MGNDDSGFFRALARGLGLGNFVKYKAVEMRDRVESVLLTGDILLCLDEGHRLWPQTDLRYGIPKRVNWIMSMANHGVPICLISTPQFLTTLKAKEESPGWNSAQFQGRLAHYDPLPRELSLADLISVARAQLPEAGAQTLRALAAYARTSARYLAAIETISKRARFIAGRAGRHIAETGDVRRAMQESVIPADSKLVLALSADHTGGRLPRLSKAPEAETESDPGMQGRDIPALRLAIGQAALEPIASQTNWKNSTMSEWLSPKQVAAEFGVDEDTVLRWWHRGLPTGKKLPPEHMRRRGLNRYLFYPAVIAFIRREQESADTSQNRCSHSAVTLQCAGREDFCGQKPTRGAN